MKQKKIILNSKKEMENLAQEIASSAKIGNIYALYGTLGAGKSFFAKNFINFLQEKKTEILSPTFNLVYSYQTARGEIFHFDLYRLKNSEELENIGFFDALQSGITLIEWPEIAEEFLPNNSIKISIKNSPENCEEAREIIINS